MNNLFFAQNKLHLRPCSIATLVNPGWAENPDHYGIDWFGLEIHGGGQRSAAGAYSLLSQRARIWTSTPVSAFPELNWLLNLYYDSETVDFYGAEEKFGACIKPVRNANATELNYFDGELIENAYQDGDGLNYNAVKVGSLVWVVGSLKSGKFQNGTSISRVETNSAWAALTTPAYCHEVGVYGFLYNGYAIRTGNVVSGNGWRIPTQADFIELTNMAVAGYTTAQILKACRQINHPLA
ncbi:MAG: hypothetical protein KG029_07185 [Bacteroidetes bacterium]|nr:hypothetical protein [Bacteroidota bacterium]